MGTKTNHPPRSRRQPTGFVLLLALIGLASIFSSVHSFSFVKVEDEHLHDRADVIVVGTIHKVNPRWVIPEATSSDAIGDSSNHLEVEEQGRTLATTDYFVQVDQLVKGNVDRNNVNAATGKLYVKVCVHGAPTVKEMNENDTILVIPGNNDNVIYYYYRYYLYVVVFIEEFFYNDILLFLKM